MTNPDVKIIIKDQKAKKTHTCRVCKSTIEIGEVYTVMTQITRFGYGPNKYRKFEVCLMHDVANIKIKNNKLYEV